MSTYARLHEGDLYRGEEGQFNIGPPGARAFVDPGCTPSQVEPRFDISGEASPGWAGKPQILVSYQPRDALTELSASIEEVPSTADQLQAIADPSVESSERELRVGPWVEDVAARFAQIMMLSPDWDGHGATAIEPANVLAAGRFLATVMGTSTSAPTIVPTSAGGLQLEWHRGGFDVELLFGDEDPTLLYVAEVDSGREWEGPPVEGFAEFDLAGRLSG